MNDLKILNVIRINKIRADNKAFLNLTFPSTIKKSELFIATDHGCLLQKCHSKVMALLSQIILIL